MYTKRVDSCSAGRRLISPVTSAEIADWRDRAPIDGRQTVVASRLVGAL